MKKIFIIAGIIFIAIIVGIFVINIYEADTKVTDETTRVGLIMNGSAKDGNWSQSHYAGLSLTAAELNLEIIYRENVAEDEVLSVIDQMVSNGCKIIIANSIGFGDGISKAAEKYPEIYFYHATGVGEAKNLTTYFGRMYQMRYLCGIVAGLQTDTDEIGYVATFPISEVNRGINAFTLGVKSVNPDAKVYVKWTDSWTDDTVTAQKTKELLESHNIDVVTMHSDSLEVLRIAEEKNVYSIGYNVDNSKQYPNTFLTAAVWDWEKFYTPNILKCLQGKFEGHHYWEGVETGIVSMAPFSQKIKPGIKEAVNKEINRMSQGTFDVFYGPITDTSGVLRVSEYESMTDNIMLNKFDWYVEGVVIDE
ncbi:MAG: BMP family ABC transporter substrate-binding protein [Lachnospiraceae bacterium]|nr:BMP family ABC transporter substrate-binding protein [Lachnospiraceae bacterium]